MTMSYSYLGRRLLTSLPKIATATAPFMMFVAEKRKFRDKEIQLSRVYRNFGGSRHEFHMSARKATSSKRVRRLLFRLFFPFSF